METKEGLDLHIPPETFSIRDVEHYVGKLRNFISNCFDNFYWFSCSIYLGSDRMIDVIDVTKQADIRMPVSEFVEYFTKPSRTKVYNVISLEFSDTS